MPIVSGGGGGFTGGTVTTPVVGRMTSPGNVAFEATPVAGATVALTDQFESYDDTGNLLWFVDAGGNFLLDISKHNVNFEIDALSGGSLVYSHAGGFGLKLPTGLTFSVVDRNNVALLRVQETGGVLAAFAAPATQAFVSGTGAQVSTVRDVRTFTPVTFNPTAGAAATCLVQVSPDNVTYTTLWTETEPVGITFDGTVHVIPVYLPGGWYLKLTAANATLGTTTYF